MNVHEYVEDKRSGPVAVIPDWRGLRLAVLLSAILVLTGCSTVPGWSLGSLPCKIQSPGAQLPPQGADERGRDDDPDRRVVPMEINGCTPDLWHKGDHPMGRGWVRPEHVERAGQRIRLKVPEGSFDGAEILSRATYRHGTFEAQFRCRAPEGTICAVFLYEPKPGGENADEVDIELVMETREILLVTWVQGVQTNLFRQPFPPGFDPAETNTYRIEHFPGSTVFSINGTELKRFEDGLPTRPMKILVNVWWPEWIPRSMPEEEGGLELDWLRVR